MEKEVCSCVCDTPVCQCEGLWDAHGQGRVLCVTRGGAGGRTRWAGPMELAVQYCPALWGPLQPCACFLPTSPLPRHPVPSLL